MIFVGITCIIIAVVLLLYGNYLPMQKAVDGWWMRQQAKRLDRKVNGKKNARYNNVPK